MRLSLLLYLLRHKRSNDLVCKHSFSTILTASTTNLFEISLKTLPLNDVIIKTSD